MWGTENCKAVSSSSLIVAKMSEDSVGVTRREVHEGQWARDCDGPSRSASSMAVDILLRRCEMLL